MLYEMRTYQIKLGALARYLQLFESKGLPIIARYCTLVGFWTIETGQLNRVMHIWSFDDYAARGAARDRWWQDREWIEEYLPQALPMIEAQENALMSATRFSPIR
jgi:hypothetical protein